MHKREVLQKFVNFYHQQRSWGKVIFSEACVKKSVHWGWGGGIPACLAGHMTNQQYISSCTVGESQLVRGQHTGNIKCMMGQVTWYTPWAGTPPGRSSQTGTPPGSRHPPGADTTPVQCMLGDTGNKRAVRILLECNLVIVSFLLRKLNNKIFICLTNDPSSNPQTEAECLQSSSWVDMI